MKTEPLTFTDPRKRLNVKNWPAGNRRVRCQFRVVRHSGGDEWCYRVTTGKQRLSPRARTVRVVLGSDGKHYVIGRAKMGRCFIMPGTMRELSWLALDSPLTLSINQVLEQC